MIIRILTDNQYRLADELLPQVDQLDDEVMAAIKSDDGEAFRGALQQLVAFVRDRGTRVPDAELVASDAIIPAPDMTLSETRELLANAGVRMPTE